MAVSTEEATGAGAGTAATGAETAGATDTLAGCTTGADPVVATAGDTGVVAGAPAVAVAATSAIVAAAAPMLVATAGANGVEAAGLTAALPAELAAEGCALFWPPALGALVDGAPD